MQPGHSCPSNGQQVRLPPKGERHRYQLHLQRVGEHGLGVSGSSAWATAIVEGLGMVTGGLVKLLKGWIDVKQRGISSCRCYNINNLGMGLTSMRKEPRIIPFCSWGGTDLWTPNRWGLNAESCGTGPEDAWRFRGSQRFSLVLIVINPPQIGELMDVDGDKTAWRRVYSVSGLRGRYFETWRCATRKPTSTDGNLSNSQGASIVFSNFNWQIPTQSDSHNPMTRSYWT